MQRYKPAEASNYDMRHFKLVSNHDVVKSLAKSSIYGK